MSLARRVLPGTTYLLTRRCVQRQFWLRPDEDISAIILYCLCLAAERHGLKIHAITVMSNHWHIVLSDPNGTISEFMRDMNGWSARAINTARGRREALWSSDGPSAVAQIRPDDAFDALVYCAVNPVAAGLVAKSRAWKGLMLTPADALAKPLVAKRPEGFFRAGGPCPEEVRLQVTLPPGFEHLPPEAFVARFESAVKAREDAIRAEMKASSRKFMGMARVMAKRCDASPNTLEERGQRKPHVACKDKEQRIAALERLTTWRRRYRDAWTRWRAGEEGVIFPYGTYLLARVPGVEVEHPPDQPRAAA
jgi:REP element-mobilizing transposase RayT